MLTRANHRKIRIVLSPVTQLLCGLRRSELVKVRAFLVALGLRPVEPINAESDDSPTRDFSR